MPNFSSSPAYKNSTSYSYTWPSRYAPSDDGSCSRNVSLMVLDAYDIPVVGSTPSRGNLCGFDIHNISAEDAIFLSLAENLAGGKMIELYMNENGFAYFQEVYPSPEIINLDVRTCVPTTNIDQTVDLVIVRGYKTPPVRYFKNFEDLKFDSVESLSLHLPQEVGVPANYATEAWKSYKDPVLETSYMDGIDNLYEVEAFEQVVGYVIDFDGSSDENVKYSFSDTTTRLIDITGSNTSLDDNDWYAYDLGSFLSYDKYGERWPLLLNVSNIYMYGRNVTSYSFVPYYVTLAGASDWTLDFWCDSAAKLINLPATNWHWELTQGSGAIIHIYPDCNPSEAGFSNMTMGMGAGTYNTRVRYYSSIRVGASLIDRQGAMFIPYINGSVGFYPEKIVAAVEIDRPSVTVSDHNGEAIKYANALKVAYQPIVIKDEPAPVAYCMGGRSRLVDPTLDLWDSDPSTVQLPPEERVGSLAWLQTKTTGRTLDVSLPFLEESGCVNMAHSLYGMCSDMATTYSLVCSPMSEPKLGAAVSGYEGRINAISYSYTDSSAYNINVTIGPVVPNIKGYQASIYQRQTEDVSRNAIVVWSAGDGVNYRVKVQGINSVYWAINSTLGTYDVGEKVQVSLHNLQKEA